MTTRTSIHTASLADILAEQPEAVIAAVCAPSRQSDLTESDVVDLAELLGIDFVAAPFTVEDLQLGFEVERELGSDCAASLVDIPNDGLLEIGKIAVANLRERSDYYTRLAEAQAPGDPPISYHQLTDVGAD